MVKPKALKVFRTVAGFRDAYVATPTKKAALEAWGSTRNLFALGEAEQVTDPKLCKAPLAQPGEVIQVSRGTMAQQLAALPADKPDAVKPRKPVAASPSKPPRRVLLRPKRTALDDAETRLSEGKRKVEAARAKGTGEIDALKDELAALDAQWDRERATLDAQVSEKRKTYDEALARWQAKGVDSMNTETVHRFVESLAKLLELAGVAIIIMGVLLAAFVFLRAGLAEDRQFA